MACVAALFVAFGLFWSANTVAPMEVAIRGGAGSHLFGTLLAFRVLSFACGLGTISLTYRLGAAIADDPPVGAFLALTYVLFPPVVASYVMATPHAAIAFLLTASVAAVLAPPTVLMQAKVFRAGIVGGLLGLAAGLHLMGLLAAVPMLLYATVASARERRLVMLGIWFAVFAAVFLWRGLPLVEDSFAPESLPPLVGAVLLPYAMIWIGAIMAFAASFSGVVVARLGPAARATRVSVLVFAAVLVVASLSGLLAGGQFLTGVAYVFPLAVFGMLPLVVWVRFAMPRVRSMAAWIAFPVIMYCCFWFVLGPQRYVKFPMDRWDPKGHWFDSAGMPADAAIPEAQPAVPNPP